MKDRVIGILFVFFVTGIFQFCPEVYAEETCKDWVAKVVSVEGNVEIKKAADAEWVQAHLGDLICTGYLVRANEHGRAAVELVSGPVLRLDQHTNLVFNGVKEGTSLIGLIKGAVNFFSRWPRTLKVRTPFVNGTVEGTEFLVRVDDESTFLSIFEGRVLAENKAGTLTLKSGQSAIAKADQAPTLTTVVRPRDAVQWALYYPPVAYECPEGLMDTDPRYYTNLASSLLRVGRVEEARAAIEEALQLDPHNSLAFALQSIIAVIQNDKEQALSLAEKAVQVDTNLAAAHIAMSYAQQSSFDLKGALMSLKEAVSVEPENELAWARLAEMKQSFGKLDKALEAANKAVELNPNIARTQTVLGFAYLTQVKIKESMAAFEKAIELDQAAPLPRLGLGLAKIRKGCLEEGRKDIEIAISLDPDNSLLRSYLGKAYYEEKQDKMANDQYQMAKEFDPKDPTPHFYEAIKKHTENRPVEALQEMQKAIDLNDNRAVYRSKFLLDADLAARSASLARIYTDLGFQDLALIEGWKSVNTDPADFSGHRFLADSYSALPRHEIARVSELLQSQLLQPININPVQPHLAESNLHILEGAGPADLSCNEFNPLFNRNRYSLQVSSIIGENSTFGEEITVAAVQDKASISAGQFFYKSNGWRENNDQKQNIYNLFAQFELTPKTSVQAEFRSRDFDAGDLTLFFGKDNFLPTLRRDEDERILRFGFRLAFSPGSELLGSLIYRHADESAYVNPDSNDPFQTKFSVENNGQDSYSGEVQHLLSIKYVKFISGIGYFDTNFTSETTLEFLIPGGPPFPVKVTDTVDNDAEHTNLYVYSYINYPRTVTLTVGGSGDFYDSAETDTNQFNPKFGVVWNPLPATTLRAAAFRTLKRTLATNQTLEPTQVAGFNQFYDDFDSTKAWRYGVAIDQKFSKNIFTGAEYSQRDLEYPAFITTEGGTSIKHLDGNEWFGRGYLYWTPHQWIALSAEYQYEKTENDKEDPGYFDYVRTNRFPFAITFAHPSGFSARVKTTYIDQEGKFKLQRPAGVVESGADNFWITDASVSYRLPKRMGIIMIDARNLFNQSFNYQDIDTNNPSIQPERAVFAKFTLAF